MPGVTVTAVHLQTSRPARPCTDASGFYTLPLARARPVQTSPPSSTASRRRRGRTCSSMPRPASRSAFTLETGTPDRGRHGHVRRPAAADRRRRPQDRRSEGHRAAVVLGPQPDRRRRRSRPASSAATSTTCGFGDLSNGGFNINGSRSDENNITIDGADGHPHALGRRDHRHPERRRDPGSPGPDRQLHARVRARQRRPDPVRDQERQQPLHAAARRSSCATSRCRPTPGRATAAPTPIENSGPAPFDYKQYGYAFGGPIPGSKFKDKLFFFGAQEWVNFFQVETRGVTVPTEAMRRGDFSELLNPNNGFFTGARVDHRSADRPAVPGQRHPGQPPVAERRGDPEPYPLPTPGFRQGTDEPDPDQRRTRRISARTTSASTTG